MARRMQRRIKRSTTRSVAGFPAYFLADLSIVVNLRQSVVLLAPATSKSSGIPTSHVREPLQLFLELGGGGRRGNAPPPLEVEDREDVSDRRLVEELVVDPVFLPGIAMLNVCPSLRL